MATDRRAARTRPLTSFISVLFALLGIYAVLCVLVTLFQGRLVYFPGAAPDLDPGRVGLAFEDLVLETRDGVRIHAWLIASEHGNPERDPSVVLFHHGNAGNIGHRLQAARAFIDMGHDVLLFDYRGYGLSEGAPDEEGTYLDAEAAHDHLTGAGYDPARILAYGESLGGAVAVELACRRPVAALVVEDTFSSLVDLGAQLYPWLPIRMLARIRYDSAAKIGTLELPLLVLHSPEDELVPFAHGRRLYELAREPRTFLATRGGHNDGGFLQDTAYREQVAAFLEDALAGEAGGSLK